METAAEKGARGTDSLGWMIEIKEVVMGGYDPSEHIAHVCHWTLVSY